MRIAGQTRLLYPAKVQQPGRHHTLPTTGKVLGENLVENLDLLKSGNKLAKVLELCLILRSVEPYKLSNVL